VSVVSFESASEQALTEIRARIRALDLSDFDAWINYVGCGGVSIYLEFEAYLHGALVMPPREWASLVHSVWEAENL
jgi:hypothetical protein